MKPKPAHPDDFRAVILRLRDDDHRLWIETIVIAGTRGQLGKIIPTLPPGARVLEGEKALYYIRRQIALAKEEQP